MLSTFRSSLSRHSTRIARLTHTRWHSTSEPAFVDVSIEDALSTTTKALEMIGWDNDDASLQAEIMVAAELCGNNQGLVKMYQPEMMKPAESAAKPVVERDTPSSAVINGNQAPGMLAAVTAADLVTQKVLDKENDGVNIAIVSAYNTSTSSGQLAFYVERIARQGLIGIALCNSPEFVAAAPGGNPVFGTNPLAVGIPQTGEAPFTFDMATSAIALFGVLAAKSKGEPLPEGVAFGSDGQPTTDAAEALNGGAISTFGGHKGAGLSLVVELLAGGLSGGAVLGQVESKKTAKSWGHQFIAINPHVLTDNYEAKVASIITTVRNSGSGIRIPSERSTKTCCDRSACSQQNYLRWMHSFVHQPRWQTSDKIKTDFRAPKHTPPFSGFVKDRRGSESADTAEVAATLARTTGCSLDGTAAIASRMTAKHTKVFLRVISLLVVLLCLLIHSAAGEAASHSLVEQSSLLETIQAMVHPITGLREETINRTIPFITLSFAQSMDAKLAPYQKTDQDRSNLSDGNSFQTTSNFPLSGHESLVLTHAIRSIHDGIMIGGKTLSIDNPRLSNRLWKSDSSKNQHQPRPIVLDSQLHHIQRISNNLRARNVLVLHSDRIVPLPSKELPNDCTLVPCPTLANGRIDLVRTLPLLKHSFGIHSIMVEGGATLLTSFLAESLFDCLCVTIAPQWIGPGSAITLSTSLACENIHSATLGIDHVVLLKRKET